MDSQSSLELKRVLSPREVNTLLKLNLNSVFEALRLPPRRYLIPGNLTQLSAVQEGEEASVIATVENVQVRRMKSRNGQLLEVTISDETGENLNLTFFIFKAHLLQWHLSRLQIGAKILVSGSVGYYHQQVQITHPSYVLLSESLDEEIAKALSPKAIYPLKGGTKQSTMQRIYDKLLAAVGAFENKQQLSPVAEMRPKEPSLLVAEIIPSSIRRDKELPELRAALRMLHRPENMAEIARAQNYFKYEEAFIVQSIFARRRALDAKEKAPILKDQRLARDFDKQIPFELTRSQLEVGDQIATRLAEPNPSSILLQGDVGSGKTIVALRAMTLAVSSGYQTALLAPTEVLARQHYQSVTNLLKGLQIKVTLLVGGLKTAEKRHALNQILTGEAEIVIGTHALLSKGVDFLKLGLVVIDEQHRFGVDHRRQLREKSANSALEKGTRAHLIVMTATPIPRTAAIALVGDVDTLKLEQRERKGQRIKTFVVSSSGSWWGRMFERIAEEISAGRQAFVVCPRIEAKDEDLEVGFEHAASLDLGENPNLQLHSVAKTYEFLRSLPSFKTIKIAQMHSQLSQEEKSQIMADFLSGKIQLLVSTTVIEVGVDVPNASVMCVLNAERFGLAQLHQLRGRIGRGDYESIAFFATEYGENTEGYRELAQIAQITDGFELAQLDLTRRSSGDITGYAQSGPAAGLKFLHLLHDQEIMAKAREDAFTIEALVSISSPQAPPQSELTPLEAAINARLEGGINTVERS